MPGSASNAMPGSLQRFGPAQLTGDARRPHRIDQDVQSRCLDQPARVTDKRQSHLVAADACRRGVDVGARRPIGPGLPLPAGAELPAQHFAQGSRRYAIGIEETHAVEMIGNRPGIGFHSVSPDQWHACRRYSAGQEPKHTAAGKFHGSIGLKTRISTRGKPIMGPAKIPHFP